MIMSVKSGSQINNETKIGHQSLGSNDSLAPKVAIVETYGDDQSYRYAGNQCWAMLYAGNQCWSMLYAVNQCLSMLYAGNQC
ncbi:hypothetical protein Btru_019240 [Bulinus truncatus]|nr:hypothetical protein Btru_019240 [Bulinus truncatus]